MPPAREAAGEIVASLATGLPVSELVLTSDAITSHVGAFAGGEGAMVAIGTGAVGIGLGPEGLVRVDGLGYWLGDDGGGSWIGRLALRNVLGARAGGPATSLLAAAEARYGDLARLPTTLAAGDEVAATTAAFAPDVVAAAEAGDAIAVGVLDAAGAALAQTLGNAAALSGADRVTAVGGLAGVPLLMERLRGHLPEGLAWVEPKGTSLDGAVLLAERHDLPHEDEVRRLRPAVSGGDAVDALATEQVRRDLDDLDERSPEQLVDLLLAAEATVPAAVAAARHDIAAAVGLAEQALLAGGRLIYVGAGTPGRLAAQDAAEIPPTYGTDPDRVVAVLAGGGEASARAVEGAEDRAEAGRADLLLLTPGPDDLVVGIAASGRTPYVLEALRVARESGAATVAVVNNPGSPIAAAADVAIEVLTGPEVLAGSTRMKAGTAQKVVLNVLSTAAMVRTGRSYGAWMVDVRASNHKLRLRAVRMLREATGVSDTAAQRGPRGRRLAAEDRARRAPHGGGRRVGCSGAGRRGRPGPRRGTAAGRSGLMRIVAVASGTSADALDIGVVDVGLEGSSVTMGIVATGQEPWPEDLRQGLLDLLPPAATTAGAICQLDQLIGVAVAEAVGRVGLPARPAAAPGGVTGADRLPRRPRRPLLRHPPARPAGVGRRAHRPPGRLGPAGPRRRRRRPRRAARQHARRAVAGRAGRTARGAQPRRHRQRLGGRRRGPGREGAGTPARPTACSTWRPTGSPTAA